MNKLELLQEELRNYGKVAIAYSGGVDSNFLFHVALETLGKENVLPVLCRGAMMSKEDIEGALEQLKDSNHVVLSVNPLDVEAFHFNHKDRCYHCKRSIMSKVIAVAKEHDFAYVLDGKNKDDEKVYRPGLKACEELGIISPLANNDLANQEIRDYSKQLGIATYNKPSNACLASRFDYNTELTLEKLKLVETGEKYLHDLGMLHVRLRVHGDVARLEVEPEAAGPGGVVCCRQSRCSGGIGRNVFPALRADRGVRCGGLSVTGIGSGGGRCGYVGMCRCAG